MIGRDRGRSGPARSAARAAILGAVVASACAIAALAAAARAAAPADTAQVLALHVVVTTPDLAAIAREVGGARVRAVVIGRPARGPDATTLRPGAAAALADADVLAEIGMGCEPPGFGAALTAARNPRLIPGQPSFVNASANVLVLERPDRARGAAPPAHALGNPHFLLDPLNAVIVARQFRDAFVVEDPDSSNAHLRRCAEFETRLGVAMGRWGDRARAIGLTGLTVVSYHRTWSYFARAFGFEVADAIEPAPGARPDPARVREVVREMRARRVGLLLASADDDTVLCASIAREAGVPLAVAPATLADAPHAATVFDLVDRILDSIAVALGTGRGR